MKDRRIGVSVLLDEKLGTFHVTKVSVVYITRATTRIRGIKFEFGNIANILFRFQYFSINANGKDMRLCFFKYSVISMYFLLLKIF